MESQRDSEVNYRGHETSYDVMNMLPCNYLSVITKITHKSFYDCNVVTCMFFVVFVVLCERCKTNQKIIN